MPHPVETVAETLIAGLRQHHGEVPLPDNGAVFLPGLWGSFDAREGALSGHCVAGQGALLRLTLAVERPARWCTLSLALGEGVLAEGDVIGLVADLRASRPAELALRLRSAVGGRNRDMAFDDGFSLTPEGGAQVALMAVPPGSVLSEPDQRLMLLMELPQVDIELEIRDMRLFVLPAAEAAAPDPGSSDSDPAPADAGSARTAEAPQS